MKLKLERQFPRIWDKLQRLTLKRLVKTYEPYHPVVLDDRTIAAGERSCIDRWNLVEKRIEELKPATFLDLGCAEGYFVFQAAKKLNCVAIGVDADLRRLTVARTISSLDQINGAAFVGGTIDKPLLEKLPVFDVVIFLSVMHHIMYEHGIDYSREILKMLRRITSKALIFDMGQSNETSHEWSQLLPKMEPTPQAWITDFLKSAGFSEVRAVGTTDAYKNQVRRVLFIAQP